MFENYNERGKKRKKKKQNKQELNHISFHKMALLRCPQIDHAIIFQKHFLIDVL